MWLFKASWELPADGERTHRRRLHIDDPIRVDSARGAGMPPGRRLQRELRGGGRVSPLPGNLWGSMPSDHIASAAITARGLMEVNPALGAIGWLYVGGAAFAVVHLGEHYVVDVLAGLAVAEIVHHAEPLSAPLVRAVADALE